MNKYRILSAGAALLALTFVSLLTKALNAGENDAKVEKAIEALGGKVFRNPAVPGRPITSVDLSNTKVTNVGLKELAGLDNLQYLSLAGTKVTDVGLKELAGLKSLQSLRLNSMPVTDAGLKELAGLKRLRTLGLASTQVTDAGLKELVGLKSLQTLSVQKTQVTDLGIVTLGKALPECVIFR